MQIPIKNIWIESEEKEPIIGGVKETNDISDVIVTFNDNSRYVATLFTYENIEFLRQKHKKTGECLHGQYFWASDMVLVERINRFEIEKLINHLIDTEQFDSIFNKYKPLA
ncbi:hypothetical protein F7018_07985 [Tenacibaculum aiptasiae]|uniref:Uncharacterized protein n=1 Tax=Tenacibaculum aiptasiae TaxID=426481 RepID=A0A7J5ANK5_9FLAO|nr:hypothetical protein [Tenacibaculum aiptasiae]KAB1158549.1 hypothetical protein F7018_07985 [Tenacibaculum aiptasiae]